MMSEHSKIEWPPSNDVARMDRYSRHRRIFDGDHLHGLKGPNGEFDTDPHQYPIYVTVNIPKNIVTVSADLIFGEDLEFEHDESVSEDTQAAVDEFWKRSSGQTLCYEHKLDTGTYGDGLFTLELDEDGKAILAVASVECWYPETLPDNNRKIIAHRLCWLKQDVHVGRDVKDYVRIMRYERGRIVNQLWLLDSGKLMREASEQEWAAIYGETYATEILSDGQRNPQYIAPVIDHSEAWAGFLLWHVPNYRAARQLHGISEFTGNEGLFASLNARVSQEDGVLGAHSDPMVVVPHEMWAWLNKNYGDDDALAKLKQLGISRMGENGEKPEYITWDGQLSDNLEFINKLVELLATVTETAPQLFGVGDFGGDLSGRALKILLLRTIWKAARMRRYYSETLPQIIEAAMALEGNADVMVDIQWPDGLPDDVMQALDVAEKKIALDMSTAVRELMRTEGKTREEAEEIVEQARLADPITTDPRGTAGAPIPIPVTVNLNDADV